MRDREACGVTAQRQIRLKELASKLGLSPTTVSRALAGYSDVSAETRRRVEEAARTHGYVASRIGRMLVSGRTNIVGVLLPISAPSFMDDFLGQFLSGVADGLAGRGRDLFLAAVPRGQDDLTVLRHVVDGGHIDAVVINRVTHDDPRVRYLIERRFPFVAHGRLLAPPPAYPWFDTDGEAAFAGLVDRLHALGHREFALLGPSEPYSYAEFRRRGFEGALAGHGIRLAPERLPAVPVADRAAAIAAAQRLFALTPRPTAIIGMTDRLALAVMEAAQEAGLRIPGDLSVVGFDDVPIAAYARPPLSTFDQDIERSAAVIAGMVVDVIEKGFDGVQPRLAEVKFVDRASHGPAPKPRKRARPG
ncbi:LacI family transcriptional regulator [Inquilinus ginsengisoli]